ncbi:Uncharacterized protein conserved in bacteria [Anaerococcus prevotii]|uniref:Uncharacterized protein n=1 Tax=Anaerococcus prevotii (strain ATCC 9321 / DSM 20548 / JCM 6508 / NCTC 11806 / PC1) TaxID=525919 RepID=C7RDN6_ANAPD|nr:DUF1846 domain-containing protein [Anaerococcus prevotii]ACV29299.1 Domain of unknown function DUF1846 [Anaerococcus prevotii DSM 20548]SUU94973.1 Uncharacterized protein conserved in bacteria [Anaerococcus prevotii]
MKKAFDNDKYIKLQSEKIEERISHFDKLYMEFGGKLFDDSHASRVLPGFLPDSKLRMLYNLKDLCEIIITINANDIENNKIRGDNETSYDAETIRLKEAFEDYGFLVNGIIITQFDNQPKAVKYQKYLDNLGIASYKTYDIQGYPNNIDHIISKDGFGKNERVKTTRPLVVITGPGPGSGKMATCLSQMYLDHEAGINAGYAKFETFPIWNLALKHPVNMAYEAATANLDDVNMIDPYHLDAYGELAVNYNRDVEAFPILKKMFEKIMGSCPYKSPTDMGVNMVGFCIEDEEGVKRASKEEIIRRYYNTLVDFRYAKESYHAVEKIEMLMSQLEISPEDRTVAVKAREKAKMTGREAFAIRLESGEIITGKKSDLLSAPSAAILNALKKLGKLDDDLLLISPHIIEPVSNLKTKSLGGKETSLSANEMLIALSISGTTNPLSHMAIEQISKLKGLDAHSTVLLEDSQRSMLRKLGINFTQDAYLGNGNYEY